MYAVLAGGVGAARFLRGLAAVVPPDEITAIVNVGDDLTHLGLRICPDLDTITYWLSGMVHPQQQWGRAEETFRVAEELRRFGHEPWFTLGDRDLALHLHRTARLRDGVPLSVVTDEVREAFGVGPRLVPATDDEAETRIETADGRDLHFQEYWVRERADPAVRAVHLTAAATARPAPGVVETILAADAVFLAPSNPVVSIDPILAVPGIRAAVQNGPAPVVGVSPIVGGAVVRGMADRLLPVVGAEVSALGVARHYGSLLDGWVVDERDAELVDEVAAGGVDCRTTDTMMDEPEVAAELARVCLATAGVQRHTSSGGTR